MIMLNNVQIKYNQFKNKLSSYPSLHLDVNFYFSVRNLKIFDNSPAQRKCEQK